MKLNWFRNENMNESLDKFVKFVYSVLDFSLICLFELNIPITMITFTHSDSKEKLMTNSCFITVNATCNMVTCLKQYNEIGTVELLTIKMTNTLYLTHRLLILRIYVYFSLILHQSSD